jgi:hypothetical protein
MQTDWAAENLQTIRTLMERAAVYRGALAPIFLTAGLTGIAAAALGAWIHLEFTRSFILLWGGTCMVAMLEALLLVRRQAFVAQEAFWSPPTRRVAQASLPPFSAGLFFAVLTALIDWNSDYPAAFLVCLWLVFFGCGLHAAGFFMPRGIRLLGWFFVLGGFVLAWQVVSSSHFPLSWSNWIMGAFFGVAHVFYGLYLYWTERKRSAA